MCIYTNKTAFMPGLKADLMPKLYSYVVARDYGFAPNPFYCFCTLSACKPRIRASASVGDWVIGTGSMARKRQRNIVYAMCVTEKMSFEEYWEDSRFCNKKPHMRASLKRAYGDNIYYRDNKTGQWCQMDSHHSLSGGATNYGNLEHDTKVNQVIISDNFIYWGGSGPKAHKLSGVDLCKIGPGHRCNFPARSINKFIKWFNNFNDKGFQGEPADW